MKELVFLSALALCSCSNTKSSEAPGPVMPAVPHLIGADGTPVPDAPEPEVVQLRHIETVDDHKQVTVGNVAGDYVLVCNEEVNEKEKNPIPSCLAPHPQLNYLLFRANTKWLINGAKEPMTLAFMQDFTVSYHRGENIGLLQASNRDANEPFGVYWLLSWTAKSTAH